MGLSSDLVLQFVKTTNDTVKTKKEATVNGTTVEYNGSIYVRLDGSDLLTPISSTTDVVADERVTVLIKNHEATVTGNLSSPAARTDDVKDVASKISEFEIIIAYRVTTEDLAATTASIERLKAITARLTNVEAVNAAIETLEAKYANLEYVTANDVDILNANIENLEAEFGKFTDISTEDLEAATAEIKQLRGYTADYTYVSADRLSALNAEIKELYAKKLSVEQADLKYANIDFGNITQAAVEKLFTDSGIIKDLIVSEGHITGELVGVTIKGDIIEGGTVKADKLVVKGSDGLFYKLNTDGVSTTAEQTEYNSLSGSVITAKSVTAEKVNVDDLVAFDATIGGFNISNSAIYSGVKSSIDNTNRGIYLGKDGQVAFGDSNNYIKYYKDTDGKYKLAISAQSLVFSSSSKSVEDTLSDMQTEMETIKDGVTTNLRIESSRGTVFKNDQVSTVLSAVIYRGPKRIIDIDTLKQECGPSAYLQWSWQRMDDSSFGTILSTDSRISNDGFTFTLSPDDVDTKVTFMCQLMTD